MELAVRKISVDGSKVFELAREEYIEPWDGDWYGHIALTRKYAGLNLNNDEDLNPSNHEDYVRIRAAGIFGGVRVPVYAYDHSGVAFSAGGYSCPWDSGVAGFAWLTADEIRRNFSGDKKKAADYLRDLIRTLDAYSQGESYAYTVSDAESGMIEDSCGGFLRVSEWPEFIADIADYAGCEFAKSAYYGEID